MGPKILPFSFGESPLFAGQSAQLQCFVSSGDPPLDITWSFHGRSDISHLGITTLKINKKTSVLSIESANSQHQGVYTCTAKNPAGVVNYSATLEVHGTLLKYMLCVCSYRSILLRLFCTFSFHNLYLLFKTMFIMFCYFDILSSNFSPSSFKWIEIFATM